GAVHAAAVKTDGTLWTWGENEAGALGNGSTSLFGNPSPSQVGTATNWKTVAAGSLDTIALKTDGTLWAWGSNYAGELGDGTNSSSLVPEQIGTATNWLTVAAGDGFTVALKNDGSLWAWGTLAPNQAMVPIQVGTATNWKSIAAGDDHILAIKADGTLWAGGGNSSGQLGDGTTTGHSFPEQIGTGTNWRAVAAGVSHSVALKSDGTLWAWGADNAGQLGNTTDTQQNSPVQYGALKAWAALPDGGMNQSNDTLALTVDGTLWGFGDDSYDQLSPAFSYNALTPQFVMPQAAQTLTLPSLNPSLGVPISLPVTASGGLPVTYAVVGPATLTGNQLTVTGYGTVILIAYQAGNEFWGSTIPVSVNFAAPIAFSQWQSLNSIASGPTATPESDGVPNLLKYLFNINPTGFMSVSDHARLPVVASSTIGGIPYITLTYRQCASMSGITVNLQTSTDLVNWPTANPPDFSQQIGIDPVTGDPIMEVGVKMTGQPRLFIRLNVTMP
ncbi:hypothetical protein OAG63_00550, partial [Methylacidiphilales bacterium]|nr:hypothetical protein [Candidatus Methylacidiphilales bacterium]